MKALPAEYHRLSDKIRPIIATCIYGLAASIAAVGFEVAINWLYNHTFKAAAEHGTVTFLCVSFLTIVLASLIVGWLLNSVAPNAAGSGIPQVKLNFWKEFGYAPRRIAFIKFIAGVVSIGGGQSLGREGPTVQIGSNLSSTIAGWLGVSKQNRRAASAAGAAAGLAAAFNAPLASVAFVLEEIIGDLNSRSLGPVLVAAVIGAFVVHAFLGAQPAFSLPRIDEPTWRAYVVMPFTAVFAALSGVAFHKGALALRRRVKNLVVVPRWILPVAGGLVTWMLGAAVFLTTHRLGVFALGYDDLSEAINGHILWQIALALLVGKLIATIACYGFGGCGGIFSPNLFFGGMCGMIAAGIAAQFLQLTQSDIVLLVVGGMSACLGAVVLAPVTAVLIIFEMTHQFALVPGLMLAGLISQVVAHAFGRVNFYDALLQQDGHDLHHVVPPRDLRSWQNLPVSALATFNPVAITDDSQSALRQLLRESPHRYFPLVRDGRDTGLVSRSEIESALAEDRTPRAEAAVVCRPHESIRECQARLLESHAGVLLVTNDSGALLGVLTLHDLLRAQVAAAEREG